MKKISGLIETTKRERVDCDTSFFDVIVFFWMTRNRTKVCDGWRETKDFVIKKQV